LCGKCSFAAAAEEWLCLRLGVHMKTRTFEGGRFADVNPRFGSGRRMRQLDE